MDGVGSLGWWTEFGDPVRKKEIPAITQMFHMRRSLEQIREDFGVTPLFLNARRRWLQPLVSPTTPRASPRNSASG